MSLPVEVCAYIPIERLPLLNQADVLDDDEEGEEAGRVAVCRIGVGIGSLYMNLYRNQ